MGALGARGVTLDANGFELALRTDAMRVRMCSDAVTGLGGATAETGRIRAFLEGSPMFALGAGRSLEPSLEFGLRHDSAAAETGRGIELGAGIRYADAAKASHRHVFILQQNRHRYTGLKLARIDEGEQLARSAPPVDALILVLPLALANKNIHWFDDKV